jgi:hypothetical protein
MSEIRKKRRARYRALLKLVEPYEITYWKERANAPYRKFIKFLRHLIAAAKREPISYQH